MLARSAEKDGLTGEKNKSQPHSTPGEPRADQTYPPYQGNSLLSLFGVPELDAEVQMGMEQEHQEALQEYKIVYSTLHRFNMAHTFFGLSEASKDY